MKRVEERRPQTSAIVFKVLVIIAAALALVLVAGTIYGFAKRGKPAAAEIPPRLSQSSAEGESIFSGIGTMRIPTSDPQPETLVINIAFPYDKNDRPFSEELASRVSWFKNTTIDYLGAHTSEELAALDTAAVNAELLKRYNSELRLGQIRELYILEYMRL
jgi:flagellar basal body-associated protein FliL